jgi:putative glycosyltransferase
VGRRDTGMSESLRERPELSVVTTLYRSESFIRPFYDRLTRALAGLGVSYELIFVDDGSPDGAAAGVRELLAGDPHVTLVELSRNFGHHYAAYAGLEHARGDLVYITDIDLEEQPEWIGEFHRVLRESQADVVYGVEKRRGGGSFKRVSGSMFYRLFNRLSDVKIPGNLCTVRMMTREYVDALRQVRDRNLFLAGSYAWAGFRQQALFVDRKRRRTGSSYGVGRMASLFVNAITSFTSYPLKLIFLLGSAIAALAALLGAVVIARKLAAPSTVELGWPSVVLSIWFLGGLNIAFLGVIGIYVGRIFNEVKERPIYIIKRVTHGKE